MWSPKEGIIESEEYKKDIKKLKLQPQYKNDLMSSIKRWLSSEQNLFASLQNNKPINVPDNPNIKVFIVRLSDPSTSSGKSGGYRLIMIYKIQEHTAEIGRIFKRTGLGYHGSAGKKDKILDKYIQELRKEFNPKIKTQNTPDITITK